jgi:hypothetical protein
MKYEPLAKHIQPIADLRRMQQASTSHYQQLDILVVWNRRAGHILCQTGNDSVLRRMHASNVMQSSTWRLLQVVVAACLLTTLAVFSSSGSIFRLLRHNSRFCLGCNAVSNFGTRHCSSRFSRPWIPDATVKHAYPDLKASNFRAFVSTLPTEMNDGFGHKVRILAWELASARILNCTYVHRVSSYASLTSGNGGVDVIEEFFNWREDAIVRQDFFETFCSNVSFSRDACGGQREHCSEPKHGAGFDAVVKVSGDMLRCAMGLRRTQDASDADRCGVRAFLEAHSSPRTLFELDDNHCWRTGVFMGKWEDPERSRLLNFWTSRKLPFPLDSRKIHIAVHVRRGDILTREKTLRLVSPDRAFFAALTKLVRLIIDLEQPRHLAFEIHVFSQGRARVRNIWSRHDIALYSEDYVNEQGATMEPDYWQKMLRASLREASHALNVTMRLSQDTLRSIATMAAADVFIASRSQLATELVSPISRGIQLIPELAKPTKTMIAWDSNGIANESFCASCFADAWRAYRGHFEICFR